MSDNSPSIIKYYSKQKQNRCGYCKSDDGSFTYGLHAYILRVEDYQEMIDRGWRRCGKYCYKSIMNRSCCPLYTIRCAAKDFKLSKTQKKILKRFNNFLINGTVCQNKISKRADIAQPMDLFYLDKESENTECIQSKTNFSSVHEISSEGKETSQLTSAKEVASTTVTSDKIDLPVAKDAKTKIRKAKYIRIERKREKLQKLGLSEEEIARKMVEKKKYPVVKTIEDYINESSSENQAHNLKISLVRSWPRSEEFIKTFDVSFDLYKCYQRFIHKDSPDKLTEHQFERFLIISPLQIKLILVNSSEFQISFKESAELFAKYQKAIHHESDEDCDAPSFTNFLIDSPLEASKGYGSYHQQYWLDNKLIAVGVIDILPKCVSSVYFFYDPDYSHLSLGTYGALREVEFTRKLSSHFPDLKYYYMGFYIHSCVKMKYKGAFKPSYLLCPEVYSWHPIQDCLRKLDVSKYSRFNEDPKAVDVNSDISEVLILYNKIAMPFAYYLRQKTCDAEEKKEIMEYAKLVGRTCAKNMLLFRM